MLTDEFSSSSVQVEDEEPPAKMKKLAIVEEREEDKYERALTVKCWLCEPAAGTGKVIPDALQDPKVKLRFTRLAPSSVLT